MGDSLPEWGGDSSAGLTISRHCHTGEFRLAVQALRNHSGSAGFPCYSILEEVKSPSPVEVKTVTTNECNRIGEPRLSIWLSRRLTNFIYLLPNPSRYTLFVRPLPHQQRHGLNKWLLRIFANSNYSGKSGTERTVNSTGYIHPGQINEEDRNRLEG